ncbi:unnamed protein product [Spirodela intermedia]|uniref:Uncharacterized protein n=1 Tax=Spirodela intermedia TaxID=51605 RepID=A0A7I8I945_SPIIN|nr:unnamed protein product [Spirodela intermedia]CAA6654206.1 unnamed protein product [Spirodela intermedia]
MADCVGAEVLFPPPLPPTPAISLLEESGDSEEMGFHPGDRSPAGGEDEGDEESCSSGSGGGGGRGVEGQGEGGGSEGGEDLAESEGRDGGGARSPAASESSNWSEAEKSRLFWETCLQSGYP